MAKQTLRIGIAGLGTVGGGLLNFLSDRPDFAPAGRATAITGVSARSRTRARSADISNLPWFDDPVALAISPDNDVFVELIGGAEGPAKAAVEAALKLGKPVVTANKALIAVHGAELAALAEAKGAPLLFEAAVMGGTPAGNMLREAMVGDEVEAVAGILNGTCNYILTEMEETGRSFAAVLGEAQALGYAEADPTTDVGGFDAAHKITILAALAFDLGYRIRLVAQATRSDAGVTVSVHPALAPLGHPLAETRGPLNALFIEGRRIGRIFIQGPGAGAGPTAAAVAADIADIMTGAVRPVFQAPATTLKPFAAVDAAHAVGKAYVRLMVRDEPGVIAAVSEALAETGVSIDSILHKPVHDAGGVPIVLTTHATPESALLEAIRRIGALPALLQAPKMLRIARI